jgi:hypothetical protein
MNFEVRKSQYSTLGGEKESRYTFIVDGEEKIRISFSEAGIENIGLSAYDELLAGDWINAIEGRYWLLPQAEKEFIDFLSQHEEQINESIAKQNIARLERELKGWQAYLLD